MKSCASVSLILLVGCTCWGTVLYNNTSTDTGYTDSFILNGLVEAGDQIELNPAYSYFVAQLAQTALYNSADVSGTADVTLRIYAVDSLNDLGSLLLTSTLTGVSFAADSSTPLTFSGLSNIVPANVVWTLSYATTDSIALEFPDYDPPTVGSSDNTTVWWDTGSGLTLTSPGFNTENYYFELSGDTAAEPGSFLLAVLGLTGFCAVRLSKRARQS